ncbi:MAG TPA: L,D-transpeptidase [Gaiellaceae bacterium]|nr:L,D-transpeptidase [Gaiellaceae bacterium]
MRLHAASASIVAAAVTAAATILAAPPAGGAVVAAHDSVVAQAVGRVVHLYRSPSALAPYRTMRNPTRVGAPLVFLVKERIAGWERVYLPVRPNGSTAWVRDREVDLSLDPYRVVVSLSRHELTVYDGSRVVHREPAGVGRSVLPTPTGTYYIVDLLAQPDPYGMYGPYAFGTSAFSNVLYSFGGGPGQIGIHGTNEPWALGSNVSHGCIRISNAGITLLARMLPLGTPVLIRP